MALDSPTLIDHSAGDAGFYVTGGTLRPDAPSYVERRADRELYEALARGEFCYVLHARQMGKSSLMVRTAVRLREAGARVVALELTGIGQNLSPEWEMGAGSSLVWITTTADPEMVPSVRALTTARLDVTVLAINGASFAGKAVDNSEWARTADQLTRAHCRFGLFGKGDSMARVLETVWRGMA